MTEYYYLAAVSANIGNASKLLTYSSYHKYQVGEIIKVPFGSKSANAVITSLADKPKFKTKLIIDSYQKHFPKELVKLLLWLDEFYPKMLNHFATILINNCLLVNSDTKDIEEEIKNQVHCQQLLLNDVQQSAVKSINSTPSITLLHGETGSGKTNIMLAVATESLKKNKNTIILSPEIGLSTHMTKVIQQTFDESIVLNYHSSLTKKQKNKFFEGLTSESPKIIVGPRSVLFLPIKNVGLIAIDEFHDNSFKQLNTPKYDAVFVASYLSKLHKAKLILSSATPNVADYYRLNQKKAQIIRITETAVVNNYDKSVEIVDAGDKQNFSYSKYLSDSLIIKMSEVLTKGKQVLLFLNRRGTARLIICSSCEWQFQCQKCSTAVTFHKDKWRAICHVCGKNYRLPDICPDCSSQEIVFTVIGTKALTEEVQKFYSDKKIVRVDSDNNVVGSLKNLLNSGEINSADIIIGTQIITKGLDLKKLSLVGIVSADSNLSVPDFSAEENSYQLIRQVIGRVGRGHGESFVIIQSKRPSHPILDLAVNKQYEDYYEYELDVRQNLLYPPYVYLLKITTRSKVEKTAESSAEKIKHQIVSSYNNILIEGPAPAFQYKNSGYYTWQLVVKSKSRSVLVELVKHLPANCQYDLDPRSLI